MKKTILSTFIALSFSATVYAYPEPVAVIENYDSISNMISISRANGASNGAAALLYPGDTVSGAASSASVKCAPYASFVSQGDYYIISYDPPSGIWGVAQSISDAASSFWSNVESIVTGASRGEERDFNLIPQPGFDVTAVLKEDIHFAWDAGESKKFIVEDEKGKKIYETNIAGKTSFDISPEKMNLQAGLKYKWGIDGDFQKYNLTILSSDAEANLTKKLAEIDAESISSDEKILKKAKYVQLLSDMYPNQIDLYYLSAQWLQYKKMGKLENERKMLLRKCEAHLDKEMK